MAELRGERERARHLFAKHAPERLLARPAARSWSAAECLAHVNQTERLYLGRMEPAAERAVEQGVRGGSPFGNGTWVGRFLLWGLRPPTEGRPRRLRAPGAFVPQPVDGNPQAVIDEFERRLERWSTLAARADGVDLGRVTFPTPVSRWLKISLDQGFRLMVLHARRHLDQAERTLTRVT
jgi:hypothetical protein